MTHTQATRTGLLLAIGLFWPVIPGQSSVPPHSRQNSQARIMETAERVQQSQEPPKAPIPFKQDLVAQADIDHASSGDAQRYSTPSGEYVYVLSVHFDSPSHAIAYEKKALKTAEEVIERDDRDAHGKRGNEERIVFRTVPSIPAERRFHIIKRKGPAYVELKSDSLALVRALEKQLFDTAANTNK